MKKSDITAIVLIASLSTMIAFFVASAVLGSVYNGSATIKTADSISSEVQTPSVDVFNKNAINPTVDIHINGTQ